jgi:hypothetical protein
MKCTNCKNFNIFSTVCSILRRPVDPNHHCNSFNDISSNVINNINLDKEVRKVLNTYNIKYNNNLSGSDLIYFCKTNIKKYQWGIISIQQKLSEDFIREFKDKVYWDGISIYQELSEDFIREFKDEIYWNYILTHQTLSPNFINEFKQKGYIK